jgi:hypothetical protein
MSPGCTADFDFSPWLLPVREGTSVHGYDDVSPTERSAAPPIETILELSIGGAGDDFEYLFGRTPPRIALGDDGRIAVLDGGNHRVQVFDANGGFLTSMGTEGQGPGAFIQPLALLAESDSLLVYDVVNRRVSRWSWTGELLDSRLLDRLWGSLIAQPGGGELVWRVVDRSPERVEVAFRRVSAAGEMLVEYTRLPWPERVIDPPIGEISGTEPDAWWVGTVPPTFSATGSGEVIVSPLSDYQLFAYAADGTMRWALQVAMERPPIQQTEIDHVMELHARRFPERTAAQIAWPEAQYALADVVVDGHDHVYVFPYVPKGTPPDVARPVDVYTTAGELLYRGTMRSAMFSTVFEIYNGPMLEVAWQASNGDSVWGIVEDPGTGNRAVARHRLMEPF